jgi:phosphopantetheinyl transferase
LPGVDLERVRPRPEGTFRFYLDPREREQLAGLGGEERDAAAVVLWSLKEAAWKTLRPHRGVGLLDFELAPIDARTGSGETIATPRGPAVALAAALSVKQVRLRFVRQGELVYSWAFAEP